MRSLTFFPDDDSAIWLARKDATLAVAILELCGHSATNVLEIGVFRGAWSLTVAVNAPTATVFGIDPYPGGEFLQQARMQALRSFAERDMSDRLCLLPTWDDFLGAAGRPESFHLVHVDGRHDENHATVDLENADTVLAPDGVMIVDDFRHVGYPGVASATYRFLERRDYRVLVVTECKAYLCRTALHPAWSRRLKRALGNQSVVPCFSTWSQAEGQSVDNPALPSVLGAEVLLCIEPSGPLQAPLTRTATLRRIARDWLPPVAVRALWRARERWRNRRLTP
ncbi:MAG: hypothetical protein F2873_11540 [Actinobacteria bacterium]|uniref:Unannotated protein n=1 Tax=freshwater metagenome TaxID=449393 RepID=A0A6J6Y4X6_9ZZZZ|nr:hypothetical protein [Actinomycetota bacterium]MSX79699.1 hypothetical protein [Actinomycetota bacterium]